METEAEKPHMKFPKVAGAFQGLTRGVEKAMHGVERIVKKKKSQDNDVDNNDENESENESAVGGGSAVSKEPVVVESAPPSTNRSTEVKAATNIPQVTVVTEKSTTPPKASSFSPSATSSPSKNVVLGDNWTDFLLEDSSIILVVSLSVCIFPTYTQRRLISQNNIPLSVVLCWMLVAYAAGNAFSVHRWRSKKIQKEVSSNKDSELHGATQPQVVAKEVNQQSADSPKHPTTFFQTFLDSVNRSQIFKFPPQFQPAFKTQKVPLQLQPWQTRCDPTKDSGTNLLIQRLMKNEHFRRRKPQSTSSKDEKADTVKEATGPENSAIGSLQTSEADTLDDFIIDPLFNVRGMDVYLVEGDPIGGVGDHPWLIQNGLRDVPTFIFNILTQWGNLLLYLEMPEWVRSWDDIVEEESDTDAVKALKRFLNGTDKYRNERLKMVPSLVEGPLAVRVLAPPKRETVINCTFLHVSWYKYPSQVVNGRKQCLAIEAELDCLSSRTIRGMASIVKNHLQSLSVDVGLVIGKPVGQEEDEPEACLGVCRFDHINVASCPVMPDRFAMEAKEQGATAEVVRASCIMQVSPAELKEIEQMCK